MITTYRRALAVPGALNFSLAALLARLPISMMGIGIVLLVTEHTGSYTLAGRLSAVYVVGNAVGALPVARLVDSWGQRAVLLPAALFSATSLGVMVTAVAEGWSMGLAYTTAALAGLSLPNAGAAVRARWAHAVKEPRLLDTAFAWEAVADEVVFMLGPTIVTFLAAWFDPVAAMVTAGAALVSGTVWLVSQRATEPPAPLEHDSPDGTDLPAGKPTMPWGQLGTVVLSGLAIGVMFGAAEVATVAFADERGRPVVAGVLLAVWSFGSLVAGLVTGALALRRPPAQRLALGLVALALLMAPTPFIDGLWAMGLLLLVAGLSVAPTLIAAVSLIQAAVPARRFNEGLAGFETALVVGVAPGAAVGGFMVDRAGASASYAVSAGAAGVGAVIAVVATVMTLMTARARAERIDPRESVGSSPGGDQ